MDLFRTMIFINRIFNFNINILLRELHIIFVIKFSNLKSLVIKYLIATHYLSEVMIPCMKHLKNQGDTYLGDCFYLILQTSPFQLFNTLFYVNLIFTVFCCFHFFSCWQVLSAVLLTDNPKLTVSHCSIQAHGYSQQTLTGFPPSTSSCTVPPYTAHRCSKKPRAPQPRALWFPISK